MLTNKNEQYSKIKNKVNIACQGKCCKLKYRGGDYSHLSRKLFNPRLNILVVTVGDNSFLGRWFHLFGAKWLTLLLPNECNDMVGRYRYIGTEKVLRC